MATKNAMTIPQKKRKVKQKARTQRKKASSVTLKRRGKKSQQAKKKRRRPIASNKVKKKRPTRAQLVKQLKAAEKKIQRLSGKKKNRSEAAKKGWETRKRKRAEKAEIAIKETDLLEGIVFSGVTKEQIQFLKKPEVKRQIQELYIQKIPEFFAVDGEEWVQQKEPSILRRLIYAEVEGTFNETAYEIADEYGYEPNEIYALWWGYKLQD